MGSRHAAALFAVLAAFGAGAAPAPARPSFSARFAMRQVDRDRSDESSGMLAFLPAGAVCLRVERPFRQELRLEHDQLLIRYPERKLTMRGRVRSGQAPPTLDAVLAGLVDPASTIPASSTVLERKQENGMLATRWQVQEKGGKPVAELRVLEARDGPRTVELYSTDRKLIRRYTFADRVRIGNVSVPRTIRGEYRDKAGGAVREESWALSDVAPIASGDPILADCGRPREGDEMKELAW